MVGVVVPCLHHEGKGFPAAATPAQDSIGALICCAVVDTAVSAVVLHCYKKLPSASLALVPMQGLNVNSYAKKKACYQLSRCS
jgi:hypothetical protein